MGKKRNAGLQARWREISAAVILVIAVVFLLSHPEVMTFIVRTVADAFILSLMGITLVGGLLLMAWLLRRRANEQRNRAFQLTDIDGMDGIDFEYYVGELLRSRGFRVQVTKGSGDLGVDVIAQNGSHKYAIQVKRQSEPVSRRAVSDAVAGMSPYDCNAAMVITNGYFSPGASELARSTNCELVDRNKLAEWILDFQNSK